MQGRRSRTMERSCIRMRSLEKNNLYRLMTSMIKSRKDQRSIPKTLRSKMISRPFTITCLKVMIQISKSAVRRSESRKKDQSTTMGSSTRTTTTTKCTLMWSTTHCITSSNCTILLLSMVSSTTRFATSSIRAALT